MISLPPTSPPLSSRSREESPEGGRRVFVPLTILLHLTLLSACSASVSTNSPTAQTSPTPLTSDENLQGTGGERCDASLPGREVSSYDTSGDQVHDVRKVYLAVGSGVDERLVMICRETDLNGDGRKDVIRYYDDEGRSVREESDRDFDGKMDLSLVFQDGDIVLKELDENRDGVVDLKLYFTEGQISRAERDLAGRSTPDAWRPDRWEYFVDGRLVRMGTDLDGDSKVDRWDRDATYKRPDDGPPIDAPEDPGTVRGTIVEE